MCVGKSPRLLLMVAALAFAGCDTQNQLSDTVAGRGLPSVASAKSLSEHYVEVTFADSAGADKVNAARYIVTDPQNQPLPVSRVESTGDPARVLLVTDPQKLVNYGLRVDRSPTPTTADLEAQLAPEVQFAGDNGPEPCIIYAIALSNTQVLITFDLTMEAATVNNKTYYELQPDLGIQSVVLQAANTKTAIITTDPQANVDYVVRITNVRSGPASYYLIDPVCNEASFNGIPPVDTTAPHLMDAQATSSTSILLRFNEPLNGNTGDPSNYSISPNLLVVGAVPNDYKTLVSLKTMPMTAGTMYTVAASNLRDLANPGNEIVAPFNKFSFTFAGQINLDGEDEMPRVVGAISTGNHSVRVAFNKVMGEGLEDPLHYEISGSDSAYVMVMSVTPNADRTWVDLETISQNADLYTLHVVNVKDSAGNALAALDGLLAPPFGFDPTRATFRGTPPVIDFGTGVLYGADSATDKLLVIDPETGAATAVAALNFADVHALAFDPTTDTLYGTDTTADKLIVINTATGVGTAASEALGFSDVQGLAFDPNTGTLYGADNATDRLITINTTTGAGTAVGGVFGFAGVQSLAFDPNTDTLYGADSATDKLIVINTATGAGTAAGAGLGFADVQGLAFDSQNDVLYGANDASDNNLITINTATGAGTAVGPFGFTAVRALAYDPPLNEHTDTDGDGFADWFEQLGWFVTVKFDDGTVRTAHVTSDPFSPDTDGDGILDGDENRHNFDPRTDDTDADQVTDGDEYNVWYSDPRNQDSDGDGNSDLLEIEFFHTSPILADTDGDGFSDDRELFEMARNPLIADLPLPQITVGELALELGITYSYSEEGETTTSEERTTSATFTQSRTNTLGTSDTTSMEAENTFGQKIGTEIGQDEGGLATPVSWKVSAEVSFGQSMARGYSTTVDRQTAETSQSEYQDSVTEGLQFSERRAVSRNIESAIIQATVNIGNQSDLAFSITNIELSLLLQDRAAGLDFSPVATLRPSGADDPTSQPVFNLGPREKERGPIIFENTTVFPNRVEALMREPTGLLVKVVNFDVLDEAGRNLVFTSQDVSDRTVGITIDYGNGTVESYRVATASTFDEDGLPVGINMERALEIIGLTKSTAPGPNSYVVETVTRSACAPLSTSIEAPKSIRGIANNGTIATWVALVTETKEELNCVNFTTIPLHAHESFTLKYAYDVDNDDLLRGEEYLYGSSDDDTDSDDDTVGDFDEVRTGWLVSKTPGIPYKAFPSPARPDSDLDGLRDDAEKAASTDPNRADTDEDALSDDSELNDTYTIRLADRDLNPLNNPELTVAPYSDWVAVASPNSDCAPYAGMTLALDDQLMGQNVGEYICLAAGPNGVIDTPVSPSLIRATPKIDPGPDGKCQTTSGAGDDVEEFGVDPNNPTPKGSLGKICISAGPDDTLQTTPAAGSDDFKRAVHKGMFGTNPVAQDTDLDGLPDGRELLLKTNPNAQDAGTVIDTDKDGLTDQEETDGWDVVLDGGTIRHVNSDRNFPDTDEDGIPDVIERAILSDPRDFDTDDDLLLDHEEFDEANLGWTLANGTVETYPSEALELALNRCVAPDCVYVEPSADGHYGTHPARADSDRDGRNDRDEVFVAWVVVATTPAGQETTPDVKSNPVHADEDGDRLTDGVEFAKKSLPSPPNGADTDDDGTPDGDEVATCHNTTCRDLLFADRLLNVKYTHFITNGDCDAGGAAANAEIGYGTLYFDGPGSNDASELITGARSGVCASEDSVGPLNPGDDFYPGDGTVNPSVSLSVNVTFLIKPDQSFFMRNETEMQECDAGDEDFLSDVNLEVTYDQSALFAPNVEVNPPTLFTITGPNDVEFGEACGFSVTVKIINLVLAPNGGACSTADDCRVADFCVDGVCCNNACTGLCKACDLAGSVGTCTNVPAGQDPGSECASNCNGSGACQP